MLELADEHRRHAVERSAALLLHGLHGEHGVVSLGGDDHRRAVRRACEVAEDHAEAVIEGDGDANAVLFGVVERLADEEPVVEDVVVRQRRALGEAGGARGVLNIDRVVELERLFDLAERSDIDL